MKLPYYVPVMLNLNGRRCVIVGGGAVAERKAVSLIEAGAEVVMICPAVTTGLQRLHAEKRIVWERRPYENGDLRGAFLVYAATDRPEVNDAVIKEAADHGIPANHAGEGSRGSFITPSVMRRGSLIVAVSASGAGPGATRELCREIEESFGDDYETYIDFLSFARSGIKARVQDKQLRARLFRALSELDILASIREGRFRPWSEDELIAWMKTAGGMNLE
ncbi:NAD(P)-dependent oxidoreductase [Paenibacillus sp. M1]|uniref:precorrin-2 dehydrogenase n=1 Tax=Paenibacillus haidiansis TaxID=1574488 RepID=A0ABU7VW57_9BACL